MYLAAKRGTIILLLFLLDFGPWLAVTLHFPMQTSPQDPLMALLQCPWSSRLSGCFAIGADAKPRKDFRENGGVRSSNPAVMGLDSEELRAQRSLFWEVLKSLSST